MFLKSKLLLKYAALIAALKALGAWGVLIISALDASAFGIPMDPLIAGFVYANPPKAWLYCIAASLGSAVGSMVPYWLGRAGGELFLLKRIDKARLDRIRDRFEKREFLAIMIPAMLPPPTPFKLLVFSAGVFEMKVRQFVLAIICGRMLRFGILSVLTIIFGQKIVDGTRDLVTKHPSIAVLVGVVILAVFYLIYRMFREPAAAVKKETEESPRS
ncbi:MAG TPA: VTT domain-containing protein [Candidatus Angelobacter sp.]